jgi:hypothetical protein
VKLLPIIHSFRHGWRGAGILGATLLATALPISAEDQPETPAKVPKYAFKPIEIKPSPEDGVYEGRFLFINNTAAPVMVPSFDEPVGGRVTPQFLRFQMEKKEGWEELEVGYCGLGDEIPMAPHKAYEFVVSLSRFDESETPVTGKLGVADFWSEPFVLDWRKDRSAGKFAQARQENFAKVRAAFAKAGFKQELLEGDDFCFRLLQVLMKPTSGKTAAVNFPPFVGRLDVVPQIGLDGKIRIDFGSDEIRNYDTEYQGWFSLDPAKFTPEWFRAAVKEHVSASQRGDGGVGMELDDGTNWKAPFYLHVTCEPFDKSKRPSGEDAGKVFTQMLGNLDGWLK